MRQGGSAKILIAHGTKGCDGVENSRFTIPARRAESIEFDGEC